jgi:nucleoside-diphosphate-sugar epimerase
MAVTRIAILGAGGFIGNRALELFHRGAKHEVVPVVHRASALALAKRFDLEGRIADGCDEHGLAAAFRGCGTVLAAVAGSPATITGMVCPLIRAARAAKVRRIIYLSSQMVHGQAPAPGTTEESPVPRRHALKYNQAKARAEQTIARLAAAADVELVTLRPGIVYGPRSRWTGKLADELLTGQAFLVRDTSAVCNAIYVDNLVHAMELAIDAPTPPGQPLFVNDAEALSWKDLVEPLADALGIDREMIPRPTLEVALDARSSWAKRRLEPLARSAMRALPVRSRRVLRAALNAAVERRTPVAPPRPRYDREMALLQSCTVRLSDEKARSVLGYRPRVDHAEGMRRSIAWLRFAGYPVR